MKIKLLVFAMLAALYVSMAARHRVQGSDKKNWNNRISSIRVN